MSRWSDSRKAGFPCHCGDNLLRGSHRVCGWSGLSPYGSGDCKGTTTGFLIPGSVVMGSLLLLAADTAARVMMAPNVLPVAILTSFVGAPMFLYLLVRGYRR